MADLSDIKIADLRKLCREYCVSAVGTKVILVERLTPLGVFEKNGSVSSISMKSNKGSDTKSRHSKTYTQSSAASDTPGRMSTRSSSIVHSLRSSDKKKVESAKRNMEAMEYLSGEEYIDAMGKGREGRSSKRNKHGSSRRGTESESDIENSARLSSNILPDTDSLVADKLVGLEKNTLSTEVIEEEDEDSDEEDESKSGLQGESLSPVNNVEEEEGREQEVITASDDVMMECGDTEHQLEYSHISAESDDEFKDAELGPIGNTSHSRLGREDEDDSPRIDPSRIAEVEQKALDHSMLKDADDDDDIEDSELGEYGLPIDCGETDTCVDGGDEGVDDRMSTSTINKIDIEENTLVKTTTISAAAEEEVIVINDNNDKMEVSTEEVFLPSTVEQHEAVQQKVVPNVGAMHLSSTISMPPPIMEPIITSVPSITTATATTAANRTEHDTSLHPTDSITNGSTVVGFDGAVKLLVGVLTDKLKGAVSGSGTNLSKHEYKVLRTLLDSCNDESDSPLDSIQSTTIPHMNTHDTTIRDNSVLDDSSAPGTEVTSIAESDYAPQRMNQSDKQEIHARVAASLGVISELGARKRSDDIVSEEPAAKKRALSDFRFPLISSVTSPIATTSMLVPRTVAADHRPYVPVYQDNVAKFSSLVQPSGSQSAIKRKPLSLNDHRRRTASSASASIVAKRILNTLSDMSAPLEQQRQAPARVVWKPENNESLLGIAPKTPAVNRVETLETTINRHTSSLKTSDTSHYTSNRSSEGTTVKDTNKRLSFSKEVTVYEDENSAVDNEEVSANTVFNSTANTTATTISTTASFTSDDIIDEEFTFVPPTSMHSLPSTTEDTSEIKFVFSPPKTMNLNKSKDTSSNSISNIKTSVNQSNINSNQIKAIDNSQTTSSPPIATATTSTSEAPPSNQVHPAFLKFMMVDKIKCEACLVMNEKTAAECISCETPLTRTATTNSVSANSISTASSSKPVPFANSFSTFSSTTIPVPTFSAESTSSTTKPAFSFGSNSVPKQDTLPSTAPVSFASTTSASSSIGTGGFSFGSTAGSSFGSLTTPTTAPASTTINTVTTTTAPSPFMFGASTAEKKLDTTSTLPALSSSFPINNSSATDTAEDKAASNATGFTGFNFSKPVVGSTSLGPSTFTIPVAGTTDNNTTNKSVTIPFSGRAFSMPSTTAAISNNIFSSSNDQESGSSLHTTAPVAFTPFTATKAVALEDSTPASKKRNADRDDDSTDSDAKKITASASTLLASDGAPQASTLSTGSAPFSFGSTQPSQTTSSSATFGAGSASGTTVVIDSTAPKFSFGDSSSTKSTFKVFGHDTTTAPLSIDTTSSAAATPTFSFGQTKPPLHNQSSSTFGSSPSFDKNEVLTPKVTGRGMSGYETDSPGSTMDTGSVGESGATLTVPPLTTAPLSSFGAIPTQFGSAFGSASTVPGVSSATQPALSFGSQPSSSFGSNALAFGATPSFTPSAVSAPFSFGQTSTVSSVTPLQSTPAFGFGQQSTTTSATPGGLGFGQSATPSFGQSTPAPFGQSTTTSSIGQSSAAPVFGSSSMFGQSSSGTSTMFGSGGPFNAGVVPQALPGPFGQISQASTVFHMGSTGNDKKSNNGRKIVKAKRGP